MKQTAGSNISRESNLLKNLGGHSKGKDKDNFGERYRLGFRGVLLESVSPNRNASRARSEINQENISEAG